METDRLELNIIVNSQGTTRTINSITKSVERLTSSVATFDANSLSKKIDSLFKLFNMADAGKIVDVGKSLSNVANAFTKISKASDIDTKSVYSKFNSLTRIITPFIDKVKEGETSLIALSQSLKNINAGTSRKTRTASVTTGTASNTNKNIGIFASLGKLNYMVNMTRYYGQKLANIVQLAMDYVETQNLWQVANRENIALAGEFIDKMNKAYGISAKTLMNYQAIFKNMLSALGDLSDIVSSRLSNQLTQLALDFSSLYNVSIASAMQKFQAVLSGQVRPIRSVSGYDITENTIYDIYSKMGGEKSMRQLNQLEKRLLRIYAVFAQMQATGATGDLAKTIESASNQARIMNEQLQEALTWTGQIALSWLNSIGAFQYINAILMTITEVMKSLAYSSGYFADDFSITAQDSLEEVNETLDEIQGKLLSFDKFEALDSKDSTGIVSIDPKIEQLIASINVSMGEVSMKAKEISNSWLEQIGLGKEMVRVQTQENEYITYTREEYEKLSDEMKKSYKSTEFFREMNTQLAGVFDTLSKVISATAILIGLNLIKKIATLTTGIKTLSGAFKGVLAVGIITALMKFVDAVKEGDTATAVLSATIGVGLVGAMLLLHKTTITKVIQSLGVKFLDMLGATTLASGSLLGGITRLAGGFAVLGGAIAGAFLIFSNWGDMNTWQKIIGIAGVLTTAILGLAIAFGAFHSAWSLGLATVGIVAGFGAIIGSVSSIKREIQTPAYATGGFPEDGFFYANSGELVGGFSNGKTVVANNQQITDGIAKEVEPAVYRAVKSAMQTASGDVVLNIDGRELARANVSNNARALSSNYRVEFEPR